MGGVRTRRYHALLTWAATPPTGRVILVNGFDAWVTTSAGTFPISSQAYEPGVTHPNGMIHIESFEPDPWPRWTFLLPDGTGVEQETFVPHGQSAVVVTWRLSRPNGGVTLAVRPFLSGRDYHALHHHNPVFRFDAEESPGRVEWRPYAGLPGMFARSNARYAHQPDWYRNFTYEAERARGLDCVEDLAAPGVFTWELGGSEAVLILGVAGSSADSLQTSEPVTEIVRRWRAAERSRRIAPSRLHRSARAYIVERGQGKTIIAGYPWFTDWGRDTFIAMRGLCLATGRLEDARDILLQWADTVSEGMLPNRFPDTGATPEYNSVDASLWFIIAVHDFRQAARLHRARISPSHGKALLHTVDAILDGFMRGTRYGIRCTADGLLAAGEPGVQLTWMDARSAGRVVTPRVGKPVEVQALWLNALRVGGAASPHRLTTLGTGLQSFNGRFWHEAGEYLYDVVDADHVPGAVDASFRPNQLLALGGLPFPLVTGTRARRIIDLVEERLLTPMGLRSLTTDDPAYAPHYGGAADDRDAAYHQGTVWPWLIGSFVEAWVRVRGGTAAAKREARARFLAPLLEHLDEAGIGHVSEIADGDAPHTPRGCPFQAWSLGELLRLDLTVLAE